MLIWNVEIVTILMTYLRIQHDMLPWIGGHWVAALKSSTAGGIKGDSRHHGSYPPMLRKDGWNSFFPATFEVFGWLATEHLSNQSKHDSWHFGKHMFADGFLQDIWIHLNRLDFDVSEVMKNDNHEMIYLVRSWDVFLVTILFLSQDGWPQRLGEVPRFVEGTVFYAYSAYQIYQCTVER